MRNGVTVLSLKATAEKRVTYPKSTGRPRAGRPGGVSPEALGNRGGDQLKYGLRPNPLAEPRLHPAIHAPLIAHPATPCPAVSAITVHVMPDQAGAIALRYVVTADPAAILLPRTAPSGPADGLWQHTCCEAFIAGQDSSAYGEFNFSPSGQWACYRFTSYRQRDLAFTAGAAPHTVAQPTADGFQLDATLPASLLPSAHTLRIGLSVVIEASDGSKSYWALAHGAAQPDFHLRQSFALTLNRTMP